MGVSISVFENHKYRKELFNLIQPLIYVIKTDAFSATGIAGMSGFLSIKKNSEAVAFTSSFGAVLYIPNTENFTVEFEKRMTSYKAAKYSFASLLAGAIDSQTNILDYINANKAKLGGADYLYGYMGSNLTSFYRSTGNATYERKFKSEEPNIVQSSC